MGFDVARVSGTGGHNTISLVQAGVVITTTVDADLGSIDIAADDLERIEVLAQDGNDTITFTVSTEIIQKVVDAGAGSDIVDASMATGAEIFGGDGDDQIRGGPKDDFIDGGRGNDLLMGGDGADVVYAGAGDDGIDGGADDDWLFGEDGSDVFFFLAGDGLDRIEGGAGESDALRYVGEKGTDKLDVSAVIANRLLVSQVTAPQRLLLLDLASVENLQFDMGTGADEISIDDLFVTEVRTVGIDLGDDTTEDIVRVDGRTVADNLTITSSGADSVEVAGLTYDVRVTHAFAAEDGLTLFGRNGNDVLEAAIGVDAAIMITLDGGAGDDVLVVDAVLVVDGGNARAFLENPPDPQEIVSAADMLRLNVRLTAGAGDDLVKAKVSSFFDVFFDVDLGLGNDQAFLEIPSDPGVVLTARSLNVMLAAGDGDDLIDVKASSFFDLFFNLDLGAGDDTAFVEFPSDPNQLLFLLDAGDGDDLVQILIGLLPPTATANLEVDLGDGNDQAFLEFPSDPGSILADRSLDVMLAAGEGDDLVDVKASRFFDVFFDFDLRAGDDSAFVEFPSGPAELLFLLEAGDGDDLVQVLIGLLPPTATADLEIDLGEGDDTAFMEVPSSPSELLFLLDAGDGDDLVQILIGLLPPVLASDLGIARQLPVPRGATSGSVLDVRVDLGAGADTADFRYDGGSNPTPTQLPGPLRVAGEYPRLRG